MLNNLINKYDFFDLFNKVVRLTCPQNIFTLDAKKRIKNSWYNRTVVSNEGAVEIPDLLSNRFNTLISGDASESRFSYATRKYLHNKQVSAISLGCGSGEHEISWYETGCFKNIDGYDLSPSRIRIANDKAQKLGVSENVHFYCDDIDNLIAKPSAYDVVILESSLHHFSPLDNIVELIKTILKPSGLIFMCEFVGPSKFQWTPRQLEVVNGLLNILPEKYKMLANGEMLNRVFKPSLARMYLNDPSEAIESSRILPIMDESFETLELKNAGGAILFHLFPRLGLNFQNDDPDACAWLKFCIDVEDRFIDKVDEIGYWYAFGVYGVKAPNRLSDLTSGSKY